MVMDESLNQGLDVTSPNEGEAGAGLSWIGVHMECCNIYMRILRRPTSRQYVGRCPKCGRSVRVRVGPEGVSSKLLRARVV